MKVFISHASEDADWARKLGKHLSEAGLDVWSYDEILPGENWASRVGQALDESEAMVVLLSPAATKSKWVREEIQYALGSARYADRVVPVMIKPAKDIPWFLRSLQILEVSNGIRQLSQKILDRLQHVPR